jgi:hypothetical protein
MQPTIHRRSAPRAAMSGYALTEVVICIFIMLLVYGSAILAYIQTTKRAEWSGLSLAAQGLGVRQMEQARATQWNYFSGVTLDQVTNFPAQTNLTLDLPIQGTNVYQATNYMTVTTVIVKASTGLPVHCLRVDTVWATGNKVFTNTLMTYRAPN